MLDNSTKPCVSICEGILLHIHFVSFWCGISIQVRAAFDELSGVDIMSDLAADDKVFCFFLLLGGVEEISNDDCIAIVEFLSDGLVSFCFCDSSASLRLRARAVRRDILDI